ncbi:PorT family protein [Microvirga sp. STR05]|uniref:PorT family protein n=1 Tax=Hymenobacter duratus TaxID=2771356 RepID=A0ABR8JFW8_9BACT|nr:porin family protein [Hymenobacter duratus]MBD2714626.1 PorT family protein [Hymenobacter duratus]MBR7949530.1 PorT family protein [Microvirga sp. STR05]
MQKALPLALAALLLAGAAQAQITVGPRLGGNLATVKLETEQADAPDTKALFGPQVGLTLNAQFGNLSVQPSLLYSRKGFQIDDSRNVDFDFDGDGTDEAYSLTTTAKARLGYLELPINLVYSTDGAEGGFQVFAGPYVGMGMGGSYNVKARVEGDGLEYSDSNSSGVKYADKASDDEDDDNLYVRRFDVGLNAGIGYKAGPVQAQLGYGLGLSNLVPNDADGNDTGEKARNRAFHLSLSYFFSLSN